MDHLKLSMSTRGRGISPQFVIGWNAAINAYESRGPESAKEPVKVNPEFNSGWMNAMMLCQGPREITIPQRTVNR